VWPRMLAGYWGKSSVTVNHGALSAINACARRGGRRDHRRASPARRHGAPRCQGRSARCASVRRISPALARRTLTESALRARCRLVSRDKLLVDEKANIGGGDARPREEWRAMCLPALPGNGNARIASGGRQSGKGRLKG